MTSPLHIFRAGRQTPLVGEPMDFSEADLAGCAAAYDPALHEAPIVVGHPSINAPAYGWVKSLSVDGGNLTAEPHQVDPAFAELVAAGRYKKISASFYMPNSPSNPKPGVLYLRHVGFLGALPPSVKGLRTPSFAEKEEGVVEFGDWAQSANARLWRRLRDWLIAQFGLEAADKVVPDWNIDELKEAASTNTPESIVENTDMPIEQTAALEAEMSLLRQQIAALEAENSLLRQQIDALQAAAQSEASARLHSDNEDFAESLIADGRLAPKDKGMVVALLDHMSAAPVNFSEGDQKQDASTAFRAFLTSGAKVVAFGEHATKAKAAVGVSEAAIRDFAEKHVDPERLALHARAVALAAERGIAYGAAARQLISQ